MTELQKLLHRQLYKKSFYDFVKDFWQEADPSKFVDGLLVKFYCEVFQYMCRRWVGYDEVNINTNSLEGKTIDVRQDKQHICIMVPPRHSKSMIFNVLGPVWLWLSHPIKAVSISHTGALASKMNAKRHAVINSNKFKELFDDIYIVANSTSFLQDKRGGELYSLNRNAFTGYGGDIIVNDDLTNAESARKDQAEMANAWSYYQNTMPSRINDPKKCIIMNIQQRLAPNDIAGHIMNDKYLSSQYVFVELPAIFEQKTNLVFPISGEVVTIEKGGFLWPERFDNYESLRHQVGESIFQTQYLQNPIATDRTAIKKHMIHIKPITDVPDISTADMIYGSHDFPVKDKETSDLLGSILSYRVGSTLYIKDCFEKRQPYNQHVNYVIQLYELFPGIIQIIEDKANCSPILQQLQDVVSGLFAYEPGSNSKMQRLESASLYCDIGNVVFIAEEWNMLNQSYTLSESLQMLVNRLLAFPFVENDDIVDAFSQNVLFVFMDKKYSVYARAFNDDNIITANLVKQNLINATFFNKEGDKWKAVIVGVDYLTSMLYVLDEIEFKSDTKNAFDKIKEFSKNNIFINCSAMDSTQNIYTKGIAVERYEIEDYDKSVNQLSLAFSKKKLKIVSSCVRTRADIEMVKYNKSKTEEIKYASEKDGFVACLRTALIYYSINI
jgi:hypothetical protein